MSTALRVQSYLVNYLMAGKERGTSGGLYIYFAQQLPQTRDNLLICNAHSAGEVEFAIELWLPLGPYNPTLVKYVVELAICAPACA